MTRYRVTCHTGRGGTIATTAATLKAALQVAHELRDSTGGFATVEQGSRCVAFVGERDAAPESHQACAACGAIVDAPDGPPVTCLDCA